MCQPCAAVIRTATAHRQGHIGTRRRLEGVERTPTCSGCRPPRRIHAGFPQPRTWLVVRSPCCHASAFQVSCVCALPLPRHVRGLGVPRPSIGMDTDDIWHKQWVPAIGHEVCIAPGLRFAPALSGRTRVAAARSGFVRPVKGLRDPHLPPMLRPCRRSPCVARRRCRNGAADRGRVTPRAGDPRHRYHADCARAARRGGLDSHMGKLPESAPQVLEQSSPGHCWGAFLAPACMIGKSWRERPRHTIGLLDDVHQPEALSKSEKKTPVADMGPAIPHPRKAPNGADPPPPDTHPVWGGSGGALAGVGAPTCLCEGSVLAAARRSTSRPLRSARTPAMGHA